MAVATTTAAAAAVATLDTLLRTFALVSADTGRGDGHAAGRGVGERDAVLAGTDVVVSEKEGVVGLLRRLHFRLQVPLLPHLLPHELLRLTLFLELLLLSLDHHESRGAREH